MLLLKPQQKVNRAKRIDQINVDFWTGTPEQ